jgi:alpha-amylase
VRANLGREQFAEVTFLARIGGGSWRSIGTDDNAPYRVFHDVADIEPGTTVQYKAVVLDNAHHSRTSAVRSSTISPPAIVLEAPPENGRLRGIIEVRAVATPDHADDVVRFERSVNGGPWTTIGTDDSSPVYTVFDDATALADGTTVQYRAVLTYAPGKMVTSAARTITIGQTLAIVHYNRPAGDYGTVADGWGLHLWGQAIGIPETQWGDPFERTGIDAFGAVYAIPIADATKAVNFIMHLPGQDSVPTTREPGGDRSFVPRDHLEIWLKQGDPTVYFTPPPT